MSSTALATLTKMIEGLPEKSREQVVDHLRHYIAEMQDEQQWEAAFARTEKQVAAIARRAKQEIAKGRAKPMDASRL